MCSLSSSDGADGTGRNLGKSICTRYVCGVGQETKPISITIKDFEDFRNYKLTFKSLHSWPTGSPTFG